MNVSNQLISGGPHQNGKIDIVLAPGSRSGGGWGGGSSGGRGGGWSGGGGRR